jgi:hypothetical protein
MSNKKQINPHRCSGKIKVPQRNKKLNVMELGHCSLLPPEFVAPAHKSQRTQLLTNIERTTTNMTQTR